MGYRSRWAIWVVVVLRLVGRVERRVWRAEGSFDFEFGEAIGAEWGDWR